MRYTNKINIKSMCVISIALMSGNLKIHSENKRPNILFALADDATWKHFGAYGCNWVNTPAFDRVAQNGILFNNTYTPNAKSAPSRACILTGRNSWQLEEAANHSPYFPAKFKTYAEALTENGYFVGSTGKGWSPGNPGKIDGILRELAGHAYNEFLTVPPTSGISKVDYAKNFDAFLAARTKGKPFCFWYGSHEPHRNYEFKSGTNKGGRKISDISEVPAFWPDVDSVRVDMLDYAYEVEYFDNQLQKILNKLEEIGELNNTIVIVTSDNGMPFPRIKGQEYEYSNHLPLAIMWPNGLKNPGRVVDDFISFIDFAPTFLELAGIPIDKTGMQLITGKSFTDILYSNKSGTINNERNSVLIGKERHDVGRPNDEGYPIRGIVEGDFIYIHNYKTERWPSGNPEVGYLNCDTSPTKSYILNIRRTTGDLKFWQLSFGKRGSEELYNIKTDPFCMVNLANDSKYAKLKNKMEQEMIKRLIDQNDPRMFGNGDIFDNYKYANPLMYNYYNRVMDGEIPANKMRQKEDVDADLKD